MILPRACRAKAVFAEARTAHDLHGRGRRRDPAENLARRIRREDHRLQDFKTAQRRIPGPPIRVQPPVPFRGTPRRARESVHRPDDRPVPAQSRGQALRFHSRAASLSRAPISGWRGRKLSWPVDSLVSREAKFRPAPWIGRKIDARPRIGAESPRQARFPRRRRAVALPSIRTDRRRSRPISRRARNRQRQKRRHGLVTSRTCVFRLARGPISRKTLLPIRAARSTPSWNRTVSRTLRHQ